MKIGSGDMRTNIDSKKQTRIMRGKWYNDKKSQVGIRSKYFKILVNQYVHFLIVKVSRNEGVKEPLTTICRHRPVSDALTT